MSIWLIIALALYALVFVGFLVAIIMEASKYESKIGIRHILVAVGWPFWLIWYLGVLAKEWRQNKK